MDRYRRLLTAINYGDIRVWCAYPDCRDPKFLVECEQPVFDHFLRLFTPSPQDGLRGLARRILNASRLLKYAAPSYSVLARRRAMPAT